MDIAPPPASRFIAEVDLDELAVRLLEASLQNRRPPGATATDALAHCDPQVAHMARAMSNAAVAYISECWEKLSAPN